MSPVSITESIQKALSSRAAAVTANGFRFASVALEQAEVRATEAIDHADALQQRCDELEGELTEALKAVCGMAQRCSEQWGAV